MSFLRSTNPTSLEELPTAHTIGVRPPGPASLVSDEVASVRPAPNKRLAAAQNYLRYTSPIGTTAPLPTVGAALLTYGRRLPSVASEAGLDRSNFWWLLRSL